MSDIYICFEGVFKVRNDVIVKGFPHLDSHAHLISARFYSRQCLVFQCVTVSCYL